ncbi:hypothetical protein E4665_14580 [Sporolactobacillus shoreae]|uniref:Uncharacterized protein n=1 Tax=Sporolactobacillus shoreae TaxID=1465501 RepID=A0A4Z0GJ53_9BACL|nr:hypothetical protein E4665_14580 [Sporolactobacillus shoreae]
MANHGSFLRAKFVSCCLRGTPDFGTKSEGPPKVAGKPPKVAGKPPKVAGKPPKVAGKPPKVAGKPPKVAGKPPKVAGKGVSLLSGHVRMGSHMIVLS